MSEVGMVRFTQMARIGTTFVHRARTYVVIEQPVYTSRFAFVPVGRLRNGDVVDTVDLTLRYGQDRPCIIDWDLPAQLVGVGRKIDGES